MLKNANQQSIRWIVSIAGCKQKLSQYLPRRRLGGNSRPRLYMGVSGQRHALAAL
jgi:hypothetical protein